MAQAVGISLLFHLLLLFIAFLSPKTQTSAPIEVSFLPPEVAQQKPAEQIVSPSEALPETPKVETNLRSDKDSATEKEQIKRGLPSSAQAPAKQQQPSELQKPSKPSESKKQAPPAGKPEQAPESAQKTERSSSAPTLRLGAGTLLEKLETEKKQDTLDSAERLQALARGNSPEKQSQLSDTSRELQLRDYQPFRPSSVDSLFNARNGNADYLPTVQDGEVTLLNAKADRHAIFVRRVALQVFGALRKQSWSEVSYSRLQQASNYVTVYATMSRQGTLLSVTMRDGSGSSIFDKVVVSAVRKGTWDQNPPAGALADDGTIRFVFKSKTWARRVGDARREQRWLLLSTGLL